MGYNAGNLELSILGFSDKAVASVDVTAKALRRLASAAQALNSARLGHTGEALEYIFSKISKSTNSINTENIDRLAVAAKSLASISRLSNLDKLDFEKVGKGFNTLSVAIEPFLKKVKEAEASLNALDGILRRSSGSKIQGLLGGGASKGNSGGLFGLAKIGLTLHSFRRLGRFMGDLVQAGSDYNETLNLWQVAMRNNLDTADQFINKMQKAYGISSKTLMNAQAVFKNMIGSLGQISDATAYALSEALVQMSADYASLYNRTLESAFQNMQSMLAGQVRPIRSAGLDMTETTLFMFYQQLGGTKTMRQLNRTEKQLLSILAVYQQMGSAGALGDMSKTLNQFANQSRMMTEYWAELKTWSGLLIKDLLDQWEVLVHINAALITATEIVKALAQSRGIGNENFLTGMFETTQATNDEIDELQGKLLDFDKFRSLEGASVSPLAIDEKLLEAITGYSSKIDDAKNKAQDLANAWMSVLGFSQDANGEWTISEENLGKIESTIRAIVFSLTSLMVLGFLQFIVNIVKNFKLLFSTTSLVLGAITSLAWGISTLISVWEDTTALGRFVSIFTALAAAIGATVVGLALFKNDWVKALSVGAIVGGTALGIVSQLESVKYMADGASDIDSGTLFVAGEMGKTEAVYTGSNGKTNVANIQQMEAAYTQALNKWWSKAKNDVPAFQGVSDSGIYTIVDGEAKRRGKRFANA